MRGARKLGGKAVLLASAVLAALALPTSAASPPPPSAESAVGPAAHVYGSGRSCPTGHTIVGHTDTGYALCIHDVHDPVPPTTRLTADPPQIQPNCYGNGLNGPRIQLVYAWIQGKSNRAAQVIPKIANTWVPQMEATFRLTSREEGREVGLRLHMPGCQVGVQVLRLTADEADPDSLGGQVSAISAAVARAPFFQEGHKYLLWLDGPAKGPCGVGPLIPVDAPGPANPNNLGSLNQRAEVAIAYRTPHPVIDADVCWGRTSAVVETHELLHMLGAVQTSAPSSNGFGHCIDDPDIMCYEERGVKLRKRCAGLLPYLDCGGDDYFHARPSVGTYLSTHWNTGASSFLGDSPLDLVPAEIPRP